MKKGLVLLILIMLFTVSFAQQVGVPLGGNSWSEKGTVTERGWLAWKDASVKFTVYVYLAQKGTLKVSLPITAGANGEYVATIHNSSHNARNNVNSLDFGEWKINDTGYIAITIQGSKTDKLFGPFETLEISGTAVNEATKFVKDNTDHFFYWGRRGPSVHLNYQWQQETDEKIEYFYNEMMIPKGEDVIGSYFMAIGFQHGYFGIQVNSKTERRVLFSVWSPFQTDDPKAIPDSLKIRLIKKGEGVKTGEFGNEGSGGQSYRVFSWKAGTKYRFLVKGIPQSNGYTNFTAWFYDPIKGNWNLMASFDRPTKPAYLSRFHSFLENFIPETGHISRKGLYGNAWVYEHAKGWIPVTAAQFTFDNTARKQYRMDYDGGAEGNWFYLKNCGFFNPTIHYKKVITVTSTAKPIWIDFTKLP